MMRIIWITAMVFLCFSFIACQPGEKADTGKEAAVKPAEEEAEKKEIVRPKIEKLDAFTVVGIGVECTIDDTSGIVPLWKRYAGFENMINPDGVVWGVSFHSDGGFYYMACHQVSEAGDVPDGMEMREIPAATYAVYPFSGKGEEMDSLWQKIFSEYMPVADLKPDYSKPSLEFYPADSQDEDTEIIKALFYIPIIQ